MCIDHACVDGVLDKQGNIAAKTGNSYTSWREPSKEHSEFVDCMLQTDMHIIATLRSKTAYEISKDERGKNSVQKLGLSPVARDGFIYEFTLFFDIDETHIAGATKDRTGIFDGQFLKIDSDTGKKLAAWLDGAPPEACFRSAAQTHIGYDRMHKHHDRQDDHRQHGNDEERDEPAAAGEEFNTQQRQCCRQTGSCKEE